MEDNIKATNKVSGCFCFYKGKMIDFVKNLALPIVFNPVLDETLDSATIKLTDLRAKDYPDIDVTTAFEAGTAFRIMFDDENDIPQGAFISMVVAHDDCHMQRKDDSPYKSYQHTLQLVEDTKKLERLSVDTLTFTNPVPRIYDSDAYATWSIYEV